MSPTVAAIWPAQGIDLWGNAWVELSVGFTPSSISARMAPSNLHSPPTPSLKALHPQVMPHGLSRRVTKPSMRQRGPCVIAGRWSWRRHTKSNDTFGAVGSQ